MTSVTVMAADSALGSSIVAEAASRQLRVTAAVSDPARWSSDRIAPHVVRGDLLDLSSPERLIGGCDVLVVPFGRSDSGHVDFGADLQGSAVLGALSETIRASGTALVLVGRAPPSAPVGDDTSARQLLLQREAVRLAERAALSMYAMHAELQWVYAAPTGSLSSSQVRSSPARFLDRVRQGAAGFDGYPLGRYAGMVVDLVEASTDEVEGPAPGRRAPAARRLPRPPAAPRRSWDRAARITRASEHHG